jgi:hypothetical protein
VKTGPVFFMAHLRIERAASSGQRECREPLTTDAAADPGKKIPERLGKYFLFVRNIFNYRASPAVMRNLEGCGKRIEG